MIFLSLIAAATFALAPIDSIQAAPISGQGTWETTLQNRDLNGDGVADAFYDTQLNITWLRNANSAGLMTWDAATTWATRLNIGGVTGWRLPTTNDTGAPGCNFSYSGTDCGVNVQTSTGNRVNNELAHLYYVTLGNLACTDTAGRNQVAGCGLTNTANFQNFDQYAYWSGTENALNFINAYASWSAAWSFATINDGISAGVQNTTGKSNELSAVAVRSGDVGVSSVPVPPTAALMLLTFGVMALRIRNPTT
jgi:hypothetical protein